MIFRKEQRGNMQENIALSVIIPAYNEESNIASTLSEVSGFLKKKGFTYEILVVDDGSSDGTVSKAMEIVENLPEMNVIESKPNRGKGYVVREGMGVARGRYLMFMDADNATSIRELDKFLPYLEEGYDAVIGSRRLKDSEIVVPESALRIFMGNVYIILSRILIGGRVTDFNCGFKAYKKEAAVKIFSKQKMNDWSFDTELIFLLKKFNMKIKEVPVKWEHKADSKVEPLKAGIESFLSLVKIRWTDIRGEYGTKDE